MAEKVAPARLANIRKAEPKVPVIGIFAACDPRIDKASRTRSQNIVKMTAEVILPVIVILGLVPKGIEYTVQWRRRRKAGDQVPFWPKWSRKKVVGALLLAAILIGIVVFPAVATLLLIILLKTGVDVQTHMKEHKKAAVV